VTAGLLPAHKVKHGSLLGCAWLGGWRALAWLDAILRGTGHVLSIRDRWEAPHDPARSWGVSPWRRSTAEAY